MDKTPYLYLLLRNDLDSMNPGKAVAHGAHAANQFTHEIGRLLHTESAGWNDTLTEMKKQYDEWISSANGFGTTIALHVSKRELESAVMMANFATTAVAGLTYDPTYPYVLHKEYANLIDHASMVDRDVSDAGLHIPKPIGNGMMACTRRELTAGYVFGMKQDLKPILGNFPLMP